MTKGSSLKEIVPSRPLYTQLIFTLLAFIAMVSLSYFFTRDIIHKNLVRNAESSLYLVQAQIEYDLYDPKINLTSFSKTVRSLLLHENSIDIIRDAFIDLSEFFISDSQSISSFGGLFGYLEISPDNRIFIKDSKWVFPEGYNPTERAWYIDAVKANGEIAETMSYIDIISGDNILIYSQCIYDDSGRILGVIGFRIIIDVIGEAVVKTALERGGYGMLVSRELVVLAHPNPDFIGMDTRDSQIPISIFADEMIEGLDISESSIVSYTGDKSIAFFRKLTNGWYLGLVTPEGPFYHDLTRMAVILILLGALFAAALMGILVSIDKAKAKSDRESRHKSAFLANMSHEIRTPMNAIIGMTAIGKTSNDIDRKNHCFVKIEDASNHLLGVINDILDMSKIEANKFEFVRAEFNFEKMLQRVVNVVNFRVDEKHQKFSVYIDKSIPKTLIGDDQRIAQVITNLLGNAIKFTPEKGSISLDTRLTEEDGDVCTIQVSVSDTGIGITPEQQGRVFSSFEQAESSTTRKYGGTGLGLAISKNIVEMMGGKIWVISEKNKGSSFIFTIKANRGIQSHKKFLSHDVNLTNVRIMVVDDDKNILEYFKEIAREFAINCDTAESGEEALRLIEKNGVYHIYFVDWKMPGMDGLQLAFELKSRTPSESVVIMITAAEWTKIENEARKAGVDKFLSKPLFPSSVANVINESLGIEQKEAEETQTDITGVFAGRRILLVEDVDINREIVKALLEPTQIEIDCAENGVEAVRMFSEAPDRYEMIFMDVQMPEMDGYKATECIRALNFPQAKEIRIIAMTANVFREDIERCLDAGMDNHVGKPLDFEEIIKTLRHYLPRKK